ncbi:hypothetical protein MLD38_009648 [Melastoma candidum]|uniref:Uncharacterized protein n=1 Tax=Melastoma candidum TaxID=119954 RepID=A0ACB9RZH7_9MYRT|nr:hypothetical protein MLD38_009648 [Melastoma candidum]
MERAVWSACHRRKFWLVAFAGFIFWSGLILLFNSDAMAAKKEILRIASSAPVEDGVIPSTDSEDDDAVPEVVIRSVDLDLGRGDTVTKEPEKEARNAPVKRTRPAAKGKKSKAKARGSSKKRSAAASKAKKPDAETGNSYVEKSKSPSKVKEQEAGARSGSGQSVESVPKVKEPEMEIIRPDPIACAGRYIYMPRLPRRFNEDLIRNCRSLSPWTDMCAVLSNAGLGPRIENPENILPQEGWFATDQFSLEVIFHNRMKQYDCLTENSSLASAVFVPYYAGIDVAQYLWFNSSARVRDAGMRDLTRWLRMKPEWKVMRGKDHFMVAGRIGWDFRREYESDTDWGTNLLLLPESRNMMILVLESTLIYDGNDYAIPYPTYFHPTSDLEVEEWQNRTRRLRREFLFSFAGGTRPDRPNSIRGQLIDQCKSSPKQRCKLLECGKNGSKCYRPVDLMQLFQNSVFCLQPQGDSYTRRSSFDSILGGCIPVFFHSGSFYEQYKWHLPEDHERYSVLIPEDDVRKGKVNVEEVLSKIPTKRVWEMREEVIRMIPSVVYADPRARGMVFDDAFNITIKGVMGRIGRIRNKEREEAEVGR